MPGKKLLISICLLLVYYNGAFAQEQSRFSIEPKIHYGFIAQHSPKMYPLTDRHFAMGELTFNVLPCGKKKWNCDYKKGFWGFSFLNTRFAGNPYLGNLNAVIAHFNFPLSKKPKNQLYLRMGSGFGYLQKPFEKTTNNLNAAIGSHLNMSMNILFEYRFKLGEKLTFTALTGLNHFSNASFQKPNLGINVFSASCGLAYKFYKIKIHTLDSITILKHKPFNKYTSCIAISFALNEATQPYSPKYPAYVAAYSFFRTLGAKVQIGGGAEYNYNALYERRFTDNYLRNVSRLGIFFQEETLIDRFGINIAMGVYVYNKVNIAGESLFHRLGLRYYLKNNLIISLSLKTHWATAEFADVGIGYKF